MLKKKSFMLQRKDAQATHQWAGNYSRAYAGRDFSLSRCLLNADTQMADIPHFHSGVVYAVPCSESTSSAVLLLLWLAAAKTARCAHFTHVCWPKTA